MSEYEYTKEKLVWITHRLEILDEVDRRLQEMRGMAEYALGNECRKGRKRN